MTIPNESRLERRSAVVRLLRDRGDLLVVAGLGSAIWDVESAGETPLNFYLLGAMGSVVSTALGLAIARPDRRVLALGGDAETMMMLGALATVGVRRPRNLSVVVIDNGRYGETGAQSSHTGQGVDIATIAEGSGFPVVVRINDEAGIDAFRDRVHRDDGPSFARLDVTTAMPPVVMPIRNGVLGMARFRAALLGEASLKE